jgi:hypothetical protein
MAIERREVAGRLMCSTIMITSPNTPSRLVEIPLSVVFPQAISQPLPDFVSRNEENTAKQFVDIEFQNFTKTLDINPGNIFNPQLEGIYIKGVFALEVTQQPKNNPVYITQYPNEVTQFALAKKRGAAIGFLAHDYLAGESFSKITVGRNITLIQDNGVITVYTVSEILKFRAETPTDPYSNFVPVDNNLRDIGRVMTSTEVFNMVYTPNKLVLQTCIDKNGTENPGDEAWGRLFVIANRDSVNGYKFAGHH